MRDDGCRMFLKGFLMRIQYCLPPMAVITLLSVTVNLQKLTQITRIALISGCGDIILSVLCGNLCALCGKKRSEAIPSAIN